MGSWSMHIEGHGIHDNGKPEDADAMMREFVNLLAIKGQQVLSATLTVGGTRELVSPTAFPHAVVGATGRIESPSEYRPR